MPSETRPGSASQRGTLAYLAVAGVQRGAMFLALPAFAAALTPSGYGAISVLLSASGLATVLLPLGMETYVYRTVFAPDEGDRDARLRSIVTFLVFGPIVLSGALAAAALVLPPVIEMRPVHLASYMLTAGLTTAATIAPLALMRAAERFGPFALLSGGYATVQLLLRLYLVVILDRGVAGWVLADLITAACAAAFGAISARYSLTVRRFDPAHLRSGLKFGLPLVPHAASHWILNLSDRLVIAAFLTPALVGVYSLSYQVASIAAVAVTEVQRAFLPRYGEVLRGDRAVDGIVAQQAAIVIGLCGLVGLVGPQVVLRLLPETYAGAADYIPVFALGFACFGLYYIPMNTLVILTGQTSELWRWTAMSGIANLALNIVLVPVFGIVAGAVATVVGYGLLLVLVFRATAAEGGSHHLEPRVLARPVIPGVVIGAVCSIGAVQSGWVGLTSAAIGCALLAGATWFGLKPPKRPEVAS